MDPAAQRIRDKLWYGILPNVRPFKTRSGHGTGHKLCDGCDIPLWPSAVAFVVLGALGLWLWRERRE
jgi:hypothetical protein